jgi:hypothetical protein
MLPNKLQAVISQKKTISILLYVGLRVVYVRLRLKCDGTRAETRFRLSEKTDESI